MQLNPAPLTGTDVSEDLYDRIVGDILQQNDVSLLPEIFTLVGPDHDFCQTERGQQALADILFAILQQFDLNDATAALAAMDHCPPAIARQAHELLLVALRPEGTIGDPTDLYDAAVLCLALLLGLGGEPEAVPHFLREAGAGRTSLYFFRVAAAIADRFSTGKDEVFKPKLIIWDLDDTLWQGTLAEGDEPVLNDRRAEFVRAFNRRGIVSAICSKNDLSAAREKLEAFGLWEEFVFPRIAFLPKGPLVKQMIADMQLRPVNVLFIDDNPHNLHEVAEAAPGIRVIDATSPECDLLLQKIADDHAHIAKSRVADYRILETKVETRADSTLTDEDFLVQSEIHASAVYRMDNLDFADRMEELISRSNQLNYTESRAAPGEISRYILDMDHYHVFSVFVWDKYGYYGLVGVAVYDHIRKRFEHLAFSCRIMHMGVEAFLLDALCQLEGTFDPAQLRKPLPTQSAAAITAAPYESAEVRTKILAEEAPRDWSAIRLRVMADCQSGALYHYSRFRREMDFDNMPRLFTLPMMHTGEVETQSFPRYLVYTAATDYTVWRWQERVPETGMDLILVRECMEKFAEMVVAGDHKCLMFLPPDTGAIEMFHLHIGCDPEHSRSIHPILNDAWRTITRRHPDHFSVIELGDILTPEMYVHAHHYIPSALKLVSGMIDDWFETETGQSPVKVG